MNSMCVCDAYGGCPQGCPNCAVCWGDEPAELERLQGELRELHRAHPTLEMSEAAQNLTTQLHIAVHGATWARPESPEQVWKGLLAEVMAMRESTANGTKRKD